MTQVTLQLSGGSEQENLQAVTIGSTRWGVNGLNWGSSADLDESDPTVTSYYQGAQPQAEQFIEIGDDPVTFQVTANGPGQTTLIEAS